MASLLWLSVQFSSVQFSFSVVSDSLWLHGLQHARPPCPSSAPRIYSNSCPWSQWCHPTIYLILCHPLLLPPSIFPSIRVFSNETVLRLRWPKYWSFSFNISPSNEYFGFRLSIFILLPYETTSLDSTKLNKSRGSISHQLGIQVVFSPCSSQAFPTASLTFPITNLSQLAWYLISYFIITSSSKSSMSHTMGTNSIDVFLWNTDYLRITRFEQTRLSC